MFEPREVNGQFHETRVLLCARHLPRPRDGDLRGLGGARKFLRCRTALL